METKQVIVIRKDLNMRRGKQIAQGSHASMAAIFGCMNKYKSPQSNLWTLQFGNDCALSDWLLGSFTKICVSVNSKEELDEIYTNAALEGIPCSLIEDKGLTEFHGVLTPTAVAVGPAPKEIVDKITGHLPLL